MVASTRRFDDVLELIEQLPWDQREALLDIVRKRMAAEERKRIASSVRSARREHARGKTRAVTAEELMREIAG